MSILFRSAHTEQRAVSQEFLNPWSAGQGFPTASATMESALRLTPVYSAVSLIADSLISLPLHAYRNSSEAGSVRLPSDPQVVSDPSPWVDALTWRGQYVASMLLRGNAYGYVLARDSMQRPTRIHWLHPDVVTVDRSRSDTPVYVIQGKEQKPGQILHVRGLTLPGDVVGLNPIALQRTQIASTLAAADLQGQIYASGGPSAILRNTAKQLKADEADTVKSRFRATMKAGDVLVTGNDWDYKQLGMTPADAQFIEAAKLSANQIAAIYHVPAEEIGGETGSSLTYSTLEQNDLKFVRRGLLPWAIRLEALLTEALPKPQYVKFNLDAYVRTDLITRMNAHQIALSAGVETQDEARALEDRPPLTPAEVEFWAEHYTKGVMSPAPAPTADTNPGGGAA